MYTNNAYLNDSHIDRKDKSNPLVVTMCGTYKLLKLPTPIRCVEPWKFNISANKKGINLFRLV